MVLGLIGALAGAGASLAGGIMGANAQSDAAAYNYYVNMMNYYLRERERRDRINEAERSRGETKLGATDAQGNRTHFVEGRGWVVDLSPESKTMQDVQNQEQMNVLSEDLPRRREQSRQNYARQQREAYTADGLLQQFYEVMKQSPSEEQALTYGQAAKGINQAFDASQAAAMKSAIRTGASNSGRILADLASARADKLANAAVSSRLQALNNVDQRYNQERAQLAGLYQQFAGDARQNPDVNYAPQNTAGASNQTMNSFLSLMQGANNQVIGAKGQKGGEWDYIEPQMGAANAVSQFGMGLMGALNQAEGSSNQSSAQKALMDYIMANNASSDRLRNSGTQGTF